jgi:hypothetical protein
MKLLLLSISLFLLFIVSAQAEIIKSKTHFTLYGKTASFSWAPERYKTNFRYDVFYYIPNSIKDTSKAKSLIFLHGGGGSTLNRKDSIDVVVNEYLPDLIKLADQLGVVLVVPSANGLNWGVHTRGMLRDLATMMRAELDIDSNLIGVSGHSLGGMGITRNYQYGADEFAFYMPMASGIDSGKAWQWNDEFLYKVFNVPYVQIQATNDQITVFVPRNIMHQKKIAELESKYKTPSKFKVIYYKGEHYYNFDLTKQTLSTLFETPRDLFQKQLWGSFYTGNITRTENRIPTNYDSEARYFWVELKDTDLMMEETTHFQAKIIDQAILITLPVTPKQSKTLRVYLSQKMIDLNKPIEVLINDKLVATRESKAGKPVNYDSKDPAFIFDSYIDILL